MKIFLQVMKRYQNYSISHNLDEPFQKVFYLENDLKNLLEFLRRVRDDKKWSIDGLRFYDVTYKDLFGKGNSCDCEEKWVFLYVVLSNLVILFVDRVVDFFRDVDPLTNGLSLKTKVGKTLKVTLQVVDDPNACKCRTKQSESNIRCSCPCRCCPALSN